MRRRVLCENLVEFDSGKHPCRKILCEVCAEDIVLDENLEYLLVGLEKLTVKCNRCGKITTFRVKHSDGNNENR